MDGRVDKTLDIKGVHAPRPNELTLNTLERMISGQVLQVITNDRATKTTIPSLCSEHGFILLEIKDDRGTLYFTIRK